MGENEVTAELEDFLAMQRAEIAQHDRPRMPPFVIDVAADEVSIRIEPFTARSIAEPGVGAGIDDARSGPHGVHDSTRPEPTGAMKVGSRFEGR